MLHIHNGDSSANIARQTALPGEHFAFREALLEGPTPAEFKDATNAAWQGLRARHLSSAYGVDLVECLQELQTQHEKLTSLSEHDEVVLWFEHDLFCQVHLIYLLDRLGQQELGETKLSLICIGEFPGRKNFRGLGELTPDELASLFPARRPIARSQMDLAMAAWRAYCSANPTAIENFLQTDTSGLPFLSIALRAHLERFPSTRNGLGRIENRALQLVDEGLERFSDLFTKFGQAEPAFGLGDAQFWISLRRIAAGPQPMLGVNGIEKEDIERQVLTPEIVNKTKFRLTEQGEAVMRGEADFVFLSHLDFWLGGVHLTKGKDLWRWDETAERVTLSGVR